MPSHHNAFQRLFRGETSFDFAGRWRRWFAISGVVIVVGLVSLGTRGLNLSIDFKGGTVWQVASTASVSDTRSVVNKAVPGFGQATIVILTNSQTHQRTVQVSAPAKITGNTTEVQDVTAALAKMANVSPNAVTLDQVGPSWGSNITDKAVRAVIIFLIVVSGYIWLRFEGKMALAALVALLHDLLVAVGIYSLSGFQVSPDTVIAFLTILGYSLYDTIVVFDRVQENTRGLASTNRLTYTDTINLSMNQVLARSLNTSLVAILPILSILVIGAWVLGATALEDFGLALFIGLTTGAYSSIFIASPLLGLLKEREPRYAEIRRRLAATTTVSSRRISPLAAASGDLSGTVPLGTGRRRVTPRGQIEAVEPFDGNGSGNGVGDSPPALGDVSGPAPTSAALAASAGESTPGRPAVPPRAGNRPPPRPRKKGRRR